MRFEIELGWRVKTTLNLDYFIAEKNQTVRDLSKIESRKRDPKKLAPKQCDKTKTKKPFLIESVQPIQ